MADEHIVRYSSNEIPNMLDTCRYTRNIWCKSKPNTDRQNKLTMKIRPPPAARDMRNKAKRCGNKMVRAVREHSQLAV
jgi:hypothetical protein